jgi:hypothetical protein
MENRWFKNAVIYCVDVDTFRDGNGTAEKREFVDYPIHQ